MADQSLSDARLFRLLLSHTRPCWGRIVGLIALGFASIPVALLTPVPLKLAVDVVISGKPLPRWAEVVVPLWLRQMPAGILLLASCLVVLLSLLNQGQELWSTVLRASTAERLVLEFRTTLFRHVQRLSIAYHDSRGSSDAAYRITHDAPALQYIAVDGLIPFVSAAMTLCAMLYVTARLDRELALIGLAVSPILFLLSQAYRRRLKADYREALRLQRRALAVVDEALGALRVVKAFGQ